jgi:ketosteroid isomerase-like protein
MLPAARRGLLPYCCAVPSEMTEARLHEALAAWNTGDAERVLAFWSEDCIYHASFGPELMGRSFIGLERARQGIQLFFDRYPDGVFADTEVMVAGDRGAAEWTFRAKDDDGAPFEVRGCDLFEFDGDLIRVKNAFRKVPETLA